MNPYVVNNIGW